MVADEMRSYLKKNKIKGTVIVASASNRGAEIKSVKDMNSNKPKKERSSGNFFQQNLFEPETRPQAEINQI